ncbi:hypothetical protein GOV05_01780 [Candidatus Woesearchaeota archaeon]|nr:hypothetical protein [Candidatus Woesearchaeota archaeon]
MSKDIGVIADAELKETANRVSKLVKDQKVACGILKSDIWNVLSDAWGMKPGGAGNYIQQIDSGVKIYLLKKDSVHHPQKGVEDMTVLQTFEQRFSDYLKTIGFSDKETKKIFGELKVIQPDITYVEPKVNSYSP